MALPRTIFVISSEIKKLPLKTRRRRSIIREFGLNTSAHGIPGIARSQSLHNRAFWTICFLTFTGIALYFITREIRDYFDYSTQTSVNMINEWPQYFPAFTVCNLASVRYDRFIEPFLNYTTTTLNMSNLTKISPSHVKYIGDFFQMKINRNESLDEFFFPLNAMLIKCVFNGRSCSAINFTSFYSSTYGVCYTFNAKLKNVNNVLYSNEYGGSGNLYLRFYVHNHQYLPYIREGVGMIGMVHDNTQLPLIDYTGIALSTGFKHRITYTKKSISYLRSPYSTCNDQIPAIMQAMFDYYQGAEYGYSEDICYDLCTQVYTYEICGCINPMQWNARSIILPETNEIILAPLCNISDKCYSQAAITLMNSSSLLDQYCSYCPQSCSITNFNIKSSMWKAPPLWLIDDIEKFVENSKIPLPIDWSVNSRSYIESSYLSIELIHESTLVENYTQIPTMTPVDVLSNVGGQTGLWIGVSFLSMMELAEMIYRLIRYQYYVFRTKRYKINEDSKV